MRKMSYKTQSLFRQENKINFFIHEISKIKNIIEKLFEQLKEIHNDHQQLRNDLITSIFLLDCFQINEIFSIFFETNSKYADQSYIKSIESMKNEDLIYLFIKKKYQINWMK